jgi:dTDP-4-dehydrorhamnose reductase
MKRVLVIGRNGQLARAIAELGGEFPGLTVDFASRPDIDLTRSREACAVLRSKPFDLLVNAAAYNDVDGAETDAGTAFAVNAEAPGRLAALAAEREAPIVHFSTDYVFRGDAAPYREIDAAEPLSRYGESKLEGERLAAAANPRHLVIRTAWLFSPFGANFVGTILRLAAEREELRVVADQHGNPTSVTDLARATLAAVAGLEASDRRFGTYHLAGAKPASRFEFAEAILAASRRLGGPECRIVPVDTASYGSAAARPADSRLDCSRMREAFGVTVPGYRSGLDAVVARLLGGSAARS